METQTKFRVYPKTTQFPIPLDIALHNLVHNYIRLVSAKTKLRRPIYPLSALTIPNIKNTHAAPFFPPPFLINISSVTTHIIFIRDGDFWQWLAFTPEWNISFLRFSELFEPGEEGRAEERNFSRRVIKTGGDETGARRLERLEEGRLHLNADRSHVGIDIDISQWPIIEKERGGGYTFFCIDRARQRCSSNLLHSLSDDFIGYIVFSFLFFRGEEKTSTRFIGHVEIVELYRWKWQGLNNRSRGGLLDRWK